MNPHDAALEEADRLADAVQTWITKGFTEDQGAEIITRYAKYRVARLKTASDASEPKTEAE